MIKSAGISFAKQEVSNSNMLQKPAVLQTGQTTKTRITLGSSEEGAGTDNCSVKRRRIVDCNVSAIDAAESGLETRLLALLRERLISEHARNRSLKEKLAQRKKLECGNTIVGTLENQVERLTSCWSGDAFSLVGAVSANAGSGG